MRKIIEPELTIVHGPYHPFAKLTMLGGSFSYRVGQVTKDGVWTSETVFEGDQRAVCQNVLAGYLSGSARWAEDLDGQILWGIDAQGNRCDANLTKNLESVRAWHLANVGVYVDTLTKTL